MSFKANEYILSDCNLSRKIKAMHTVCAPSDFTVSTLFGRVTNINEFFFSYLMNSNFCDQNTRHFDYLLSVNSYFLLLKDACQIWFCKVDTEVLVLEFSLCY